MNYSMSMFKFSKSIKMTFKLKIIIIDKYNKFKRKYMLINFLLLYWKYFYKVKIHRLTMYYLLLSLYGVDEISQTYQILFYLHNSNIRNFANY